MALWSEAYRRHPACREYEDELCQIHARSARESDATRGMTFWREAIARIDAIEAERIAAATERRDRALAAEGLQVVEMPLVVDSRQEGYMLDLVTLS